MRRHRHQKTTSHSFSRSPSFWLGVFGLVLSVTLMAMSLILDYEAKTNRLGFIFNGVGYSFAVFTEIAFTALIIYAALKGADQRLLWLAIFIIAGMFVCGVVIFYG